MNSALKGIRFVLNVYMNSVKYSYLASATLILHPPENSLHFLFIMACVKPRPRSRLEAFTSAQSAPNSSNRSYTCVAFDKMEPLTVI